MSGAERVQARKTLFDRYQAARIDDEDPAEWAERTGTTWFGKLLVGIELVLAEAEAEAHAAGAGR